MATLACGNGVRRDSSSARNGFEGSIGDSYYGVFTAWHAFGIAKVYYGVRRDSNSACNTMQSDLEVGIRLGW
jgi:hypothetical protein